MQTIKNICRPGDKKEVFTMKRLKKMMLAVLVLFYVGITITITLPDIPDSGAETYGANGDSKGENPFGPFDEGEGNEH